ncbi:MAG: DUF87 domain-containing protein [Bacteroidetes bacterium]|nr:MAG: DUF87 domain-containing protein [Bacteroidota bacterium]
MDVLIGYADIDIDYVIDKMNRHCRSVDKKLRKVDILTGTNNSNYHDQLIAKRGFTFDEYLWLFDGGLDERQYHNYPVFNFLKIVTDVQRRYFTARYERTTEDYLKLIQKIKNPTIESFFSGKLGFYVPISDRKRHTIILGATGSGKTVMAKNLYYHTQTLTNHSIVCIDPHGDLARDILWFDTNRDSDKLIYIDPALEKGFTCVINPLQLKDRSDENVEVFTEHIIDVIEQTMPRNASFTAQMATILAPCVHVLLKKGDATFHDLQRFMDDDRNADLVKLGLESDHRAFFENLFFFKKYATSKESIATRIQQLLNVRQFRQLTCGKSTIDLESAMNRGKHVVVNLSKANVSEKIVPVIGRFIVSMMLGYAFKRARTDSYRRPTFLMMDEWQNFTSNKVQVILDEARKFGLHLVLINQFIDQITDNELKKSVKANTNVKIIGKTDYSNFNYFRDSYGYTEEKAREVHGKIKNFHFLVKSGDKNPRIINGSAEIEKQKYKLTREEFESLKKKILQKYYVPIGENRQPTVDDLAPKYGR